MQSQTSYDTSFLEFHGAIYRVSYPVPKDLQLRLGKTRLKRSLGTGDIRRAVKLKETVIGEFAKLIDTQRRAMHVEAKQAEKLLLLASPVQKGLDFRNLLDHPDNGEEDLEAIRMDVALEHSAFLGKQIDEIHDEEHGPIAVYENEKDAALFLRTVYPDVHEQRLDNCHKAYIDHLKTKLQARTIADDERAFRYLKEWCREQNISLDMTKFTSLMARTFLREFENHSGKITAVTKAKYINRLKKLWVELKIYGLATENVWIDHIERAPAKSDDERERAFTMDEVRRLLVGNAPRKLHDLIMIGLLTGARLDAIVSLKVKSVGEDYIIFEKRKRETGDRAVPMHPALKPIFDRRTANKRPSDDLFPDWPKPKKEGSLRERSFKASNAFTAYRQKAEVNVHDQLPGARRSRVNFHSCRRWFITHFRRNATLSLTRAVVGHSQVTMTDKIYAGGPLFEKAKPKIFQLELPPLTDTPVKEPRGINLYEYLKLDKLDPSEIEEEMA